MQTNQKNDFLKDLALATSVYYRNLPWRYRVFNDSTAYYILVSEFMLQQTQVQRVVPKFENFLLKFPTCKSLAEANLAEVLQAWNGLGYNRRAAYLHQAAQKLQAAAQPWTLQQLLDCKGIGYNTAAAVCVYAYNQPHIFIETNIRTVVIHYFFEDKDQVHDKDILTVVTKLLDESNPRTWYWALMDMGARLKSQRTAHLPKMVAYKKQSLFKGSTRQLRGIVIKCLTESPHTIEQLQQKTKDQRLDDVLLALTAEGLISQHGTKFILGS